MKDIGFRICSGKGFHITFENGWTVSVQFGPGNYADNYDMRIGESDVAAGKKGSTTAECAVINPHGALVEIDGEDGTVTNRSPPARVLELLQWAAAQPPNKD